MNVYILRHASAGTRRANPVIDRKRPLDKEGKGQCLLVGSYLNALKIHFDLVASSPLKRALQTASLVGTEVGFDGGIKVTDALAPEANAGAFHHFINELQGYENVLLVGHNPNLPLFLATLLMNGSAAPGRSAIRLRKGAIARVDLTRRPGMLHWLVDPRILRGVYGNATKTVRRRALKAQGGKVPGGKAQAKKKPE